MKAVFRGFLSILFALFFALNSFSQSQAVSKTPQDSQIPDTNSCYSLDIIFIVDQSESMSEPYVPKDPTNQRETAVEAMIDWVAENAMDRCPDSRNQVGVVSFGGSARIDLPMQEISPDDFKEYLALTTRVHESIVAENLGLTNPLTAFILAKKMFSESAITSGGPRKKVIVFLTDGIINMDDGMPTITTTGQLVDWINQNLPFDPTLLIREQCFADLKSTYGTLNDSPYEKVNKCLQNEATDEAYNSSTYLQMVLMNYGEAWPKSVKKLYEDVTASHGGSVMDFYDEGKTENRNEIPTYFQTVLADLTGIPSGITSCGANVVNPYLNRATFIFYKYSPDTIVKLRYVDNEGVSHEISGNKSDTDGFDVAEYYQYGTNERYIFNNPYPGIWYIESDRCSNGGVNIFYSDVSIDTAKFALNLPVIPQYDIEPYYDASDPFYITYQLRDTAGNIIEDSSDPFFKVNAIAKITNPKSNQVIEYPMEWIDAENEYKTIDPIQVPDPGIYKVDLLGTIKVHEGNLSADNLSKEIVFKTNRTLFEHSALEFEVNKVTPFVINPVTPKDNQKIGQIHTSILKGWPLKISPLMVNIHVSWRGEEMDSPLSEILVDPLNSFTAWIEFHDGTKSDPITLQPDPKDPYGFIGTFENIDTTDPMTLKVSLSGKYDSDYRPDERILSLAISRYDSLPFYKESFYYLLLALIIAAILFLIIRNLIITNKRIVGEIVIVENGVEKYTRPLAINMKSRLFPTPTYCIPKNELENNPELMLKSICFHYLPKEYDAEHTILPRKIFVAGVCSCNQPFGFELIENDLPQPYCDQTNNELFFRNQ